jgi:hypothetical protein
MLRRECVPCDSQFQPVTSPWLAKKQVVTQLSSHTYHLIPLCRILITHRFLALRVGAARVGPPCSSGRGRRSSIRQTLKPRRGFGKILAANARPTPLGLYRTRGFLASPASSPPMPVTCASGPRAISPGCLIIQITVPPLIKT